MNLNHWYQWPALAIGAHDLALLIAFICCAIAGSKRIRATPDNVAIAFATLAVCAAVLFLVGCAS